MARTGSGRALCVVTVIGVVLAVASPVEAARPPAEVELVGEFEIIREQPAGSCQLAVPTTISGTIELTIDFVAGTAEGWIEGTGTGDQVIPPTCNGGEGDRIYRAGTTFSGPISRDADDVLSGTDLIGTIDGTTGEFLLHAIIEIEGWGFSGVPGKLYSCAGSDGLQSECPLPLIVTPQPAYITGRALTGEVPEIHVDWYTNFCAKVTTDAIRYGPAGCPTGSRASPSVASFVPAVNADPVIDALRADPLNPFVGDTVRLTVDATDPDGDPLSYSWTAEELVDSDGSRASWQPASARDYTITVRVEDDMGGADEESTTIAVFLSPPATTAVEEDLSGVAPGSADPSEDRPDEPLDEQRQADQDAPAGSPLGDGGGLLGDVPVWVVILVALMGGLLALGLLLRGWDRAEAVWATIAADRPGPSASEAPPRDHLGAAGSGHVEPNYPEVDMVDSDGRKIGTLYQGQSYQTAGTVKSPDGSIWTAVQLPDGTSGWVHESYVKPTPEMGSGSSGFSSGVTYSHVTLTKEVKAFQGFGLETTLGPGVHIMGPPGDHGYTAIYEANGTVWGSIRNVDNPTLRARSFETGPLIQVRQPGGQVVAHSGNPGSYLLGPQGQNGFAPIYDGASGEELGFHKVEKTFWQKLTGAASP